MSRSLGQRIPDPATGAANARLYDRAWLILLGASLCMFCGGPAVIYYTFGVFLPEIIADTHWSGAAVAAAILPGTLVSAAAGPLIGRVTDKFGVRVVAMVGGPTFALGLALLGICPHSGQAFTAWWMLMSLLGFAGSQIAYAHTVTGWFDKRRGMAISTMFCCGALGIAAWPRYAAFLIANLGWRHAFIVMGVSAGAVIFLSGLLLLKNAPPEASIAERSNQQPGMTVGKSFRTVRFWKMAAIFLLITAVLGGTATTFPVILRHRGADAQTAAAIMSVIGISMFLGRLLLGFMLDRWFAPHITIAITIVSMLAFVLMIVSASKGALLIAAALVGFGLGTEFAVAAYIVSRAFGFRSFGTIYGVISIATSIGAAIGPAVIGVSLVGGVGVSVICTFAIIALIPAVIILLTLRKRDLPFGITAASST